MPHLKGYSLKVTQKGKKFHYEAKNDKGEVLITRTSGSDGYLAVMVCKNGDGTLFVPNFFFSRLNLIGKGDSRRYFNQMIGYISRIEQAV